MFDISKEQKNIGLTLFKKFKSEMEKAQKFELDGSINILKIIIEQRKVISI